MSYRYNQKQKRDRIQRINTLYTVYRTRVQSFLFKTKDQEEPGNSVLFNIQDNMQIKSIVRLRYCMRIYNYNTNELLI